MKKTVEKIQETKDEVLATLTEDEHQYLTKLQGISQEAQQAFNEAQANLFGANGAFVHFQNHLREKYGVTVPGQLHPDGTIRKIPEEK